MRLSIALGALASGLMLGSAALAADAPQPPAAPIFYCPAAPGKNAPAAPASGAPGKSCPPAAHAAPTAPVARVEHRREEPRHEPRYAEGRWVAHEAPPPREDVSASQAFIYRYERAMHGLNAQAADQAWAHAEAPPPPGFRDDRRVIREREYAQAAQPQPPVVAPLPPPAPPEHVYVQPAPPPPVVVEVAPTPPARVYVERMAPPPPPPVYAPACPDHCPMSDNHDGWRDHHADAEAPPAYERREYAQTAPPPAYSRHEEHYGYINQPPAQVYERREEHYGYVNPPPAGYAEREARESFERDHGYAYERRETEQSSGWRYSDGHDGYAERYEDRRGPCPPSPDHGCSAASGDGYGAVYQYSGRDAYGFLVWPGKADGQ